MTYSGMHNYIYKNTRINPSTISDVLAAAVTFMEQSLMDEKLGNYVVFHGVGTFQVKLRNAPATVMAKGGGRRQFCSGKLTKYPYIRFRASGTLRALIKKKKI
jgi:nucleoid DNA-binding protein